MHIPKLKNFIKYQKGKKMQNKHIDLLGLKARERVSGISGVITSVSFDLFGCVQAVITPPAENGEYKAGTWFDVTRLEITDHNPIMEKPDFSAGYVAEGKKGAADKPLP